MSYLSPFMTLLINAVKKAASPLNRDFSEIERLQSSVKSYKDFVVSAYGKVDRALRTELGRIKPDFPIAVDGQPKPKGSCFVVAPIDGLNNFAHGIPQFAISVAVFENGAGTAAIVYNPASDELFFAEKGKGAYKEGFRNHERLRVSARRELSEALISTLVSYKSDVAEYIKLHDSVVRAVDNVRVLGAVSLDLACVAAGRLDATVSLGNKFSEIAAGLLLVKEAGGYVLDMNQKDIRTENLSLVLESGNLIATNAELSKKVYELVHK